MYEQLEKIIKESNNIASEVLEFPQKVVFRISEVKMACITSMMLSLTNISQNIY